MATVSIYLVHHPECKLASKLSTAMYEWFRLGYLSGDQSGAGVPVYYRRFLTGNRLSPIINFKHSTNNVVVLLADRDMVLDSSWRAAIHGLCDLAKKNKRRALVLPVALHDSFYRLSEIYNEFNPIRLLGYDHEKLSDLTQATAVLRRAITESIARRILSKQNTSSPLKVFLSHAKRDGRVIAESIRDDIRSFGQMEAWYDANDLPLGGQWSENMKLAAKKTTAAMVAIRTDAYPTRPWCRMEAALSRTPSRISRSVPGIWKVQPTVAVDFPESSWVKGMPMLLGVPRIGWEASKSKATCEQVVDRLVLEILLGAVHSEVAKRIRNYESSSSLAGQSCYINWVPDVWTLASLRSQLDATPNAMASRSSPLSSKVKRVVYPGYGLTALERQELEPVLQSFHPDTKLVSFENVMK